MNKYRLICGPNGTLVKDIVELAKGKPLQSVGIAMHVLADTWAHRNFAGTPSLAINNTNDEFYEFITDEEGEHKRKISTAFPRLMIWIKAFIPIACIREMRILS